MSVPGPHPCLQLTLAFEWLTCWSCLAEVGGCRRADRQAGAGARSQGGRDRGGAGQLQSGRDDLRAVGVLGDVLRLPRDAAPGSAVLSVHCAARAGAASHGVCRGGCDGRCQGGAIAIRLGTFEHSSRVQPQPRSGAAVSRRRTSAPRGRRSRQPCTQNRRKPCLTRELARELQRLTPRRRRSTTPHRRCCTLPR